MALRMAARASTVTPLSPRDRKSTRLNSSHGYIWYAVFCLQKKKHDQHPICQKPKPCHLNAPLGLSGREEPHTAGGAEAPRARASLTNKNFDYSRNYRPWV